MKSLQTVHGKTILPLVAIMMTFLFLGSSCYTTRRVDDRDRPIYETQRIPVYEEIDKVEYRIITTPLFLDANQREASKPIGLAILDFYNGVGTRTVYHETVTNIFYSRLIGSQGVWEKFQPYEPPNLKMMFSRRELNIHNKRLMEELSSASIPFAVSAEITNAQLPNLTLQIYRTSNGTAIFSHSFMTTDASNAIDDAVRFLLSEELPYYTTENIIARHTTERKKMGYEKKEVREYDSSRTSTNIASILLLGLIIAALLVDN